MKLKIINPKIPLTLLLVAVAGMLLMLFSATDAIAAAGGILLIAASVLFIFVYFPILTVMLYGDKIENKDAIVRKIGVFSILFFLLGIIFKIQQWTGSGPIVVVGVMFFYLNFLPAWYSANFKRSTPYQRTLYFVFCTTLGLMMASYQFKTMHWPWANVLLSITFYVSTCVLLPFALITLIVKREKRYFDRLNTFLFGFVIAYVLGGIVTTKMTTRAFTANNKNQLNIENNLKLYEAKNRFLYETFDKGTSSDSAYAHLRAKAFLLKTVAQQSYDRIQRQKAYLVLKTDGLETANDSISFKQIRDKTNYEIPTLVLLGEDPEHPRTDSNSALALKAGLQSFIRAADSLVPEEYALQLKNANPFNFNDVAQEDSIIQSWEVANFDHQALATVYTTLTGFQANIRFIEMSVLNELFTKANAGNKENMAARLAELAMKYETQKQEKKIEMLQKDQELVEVRMQAKDAEISNREDTIGYFIIGMIGFGILTIFIVRSNVLRKEANRVLAEQKAIIARQKAETEEQKHLLEEKQKEILDSIAYAKRLQEAILPPKNFVDKHLPDNFILYRPKDLVAGDFFFMEVLDGYMFIAAADSTGHGVPGAMVSVVCSNALNRSVKEFELRDTGRILDKTRELVLETFSKSESEVKDGMDISLLCIHTASGRVSWSGANNPLWYVQQGEVKEIKADKQPIGSTEHPRPFTTHRIEQWQNGIFYLFTDGYADQFGGEKGKKFKYKQLEELLLSLAGLPMAEQSRILDQRFESWRGELEQVDDVCIVGIRLQS